VNAAVDINKLAANSVGTNQIVNSAVTLAKMAANSVGSSQLNDLSVSVNKIVNSSVTTDKVADGAITRAKIANGVAPEIGVAISTCSDQQYAAIPSGFVASECIFFGAFSYIYHSVPASQSSYLYMYHSAISSDGQVYLYNYSNHTTNAYVRVLTLAKKGGWV
jgi:hypothetical protein